MTARPAGERTISDFVYLGFNKQVLALDRYTGDVVWTWKASSGSGFVSLLIDVDRLIVSVQGYTWCLDPIFGQEVWHNPLKGFGVGIASLASMGGSTRAGQAAALAAQQAAAQQAAASSAAAN